MDKETSRNTIIFVVCAILMLAAYQFLVLGPNQKREQAARTAQAAEALKAPPGTPVAGAAPVYIAPEAALDRPHVAIVTPALTGSISLEGARFDDLDLNEYHVALDKNSDLVDLLSPVGAQYAYYAQFGWSGANLPGMPDEHTVWTAATPGPLTPESPVRLTYDNGLGLTFVRDISVDKHFLFTIKDTVINAGPGPVTLTPNAVVRREGLRPPPPKVQPSNDGAFTMLSENGKFIKHVRKYRDWAKAGRYTAASVGGWVGIGDKYWLTALIPGDQNPAVAGLQKQPINVNVTATAAAGGTTYEVRYDAQPRIVAPGTQIEEIHRLFAGAKREPLLASYAKDQDIPRFVDAIDWGMFYFITKPLFWMIKLFEGWVGNFGLAILMLTVVIKVAFFYPTFSSIEMGAKIKRAAPKLEKLKERYKDDPAQYQKEMAKIYQESGINPLLGCLPMLATIPVFFGLFKVLSTTIEMRQAPFFLWIHDLSAPDPSTIWNLFGLIPWNPATAPLIGGILDGPLHLGVWPLLYGMTMFLTQSMSPPATDPTQAAIMKWLPLIFTFVLANFPAGLMIYYCWSNLLTIVQQYVSYHRLKQDNPIDRLIGLLTGKPAPSG